jgi:hypothetical protein
VTDHEHDDGLMTRAEVASHLRTSLSSVDRLRREGALGPEVKPAPGHRGVRLYRAQVASYVDTNTPAYGIPRVE